MLARASWTYEDRIAMQLIGVEGMHRLRQFGEYIVRDIDQVVDTVEADAFEPRLEPPR